MEGEARVPCAASWPPAFHELSQPAVSASSDGGLIVRGSQPARLAAAWTRHGVGVRDHLRDQAGLRLPGAAALSSSPRDARSSLALVLKVVQEQRRASNPVWMSTGKRLWRNFSDADAPGALSTARSRHRDEGSDAPLGVDNRTCLSGRPSPRI